jgi:hypothetical protein
MGGAGLGIWEENSGKGEQRGLMRKRLRPRSRDRASSSGLRVSNFQAANPDEM